MNCIRLAAAAFLLGACAAPEAQADVIRSKEAKPFAFAAAGELLEFAYAYPAAAAAQPRLNSLLQRDLARVRAEAEKFAREDQASAAGTDRPFHQHYLHKDWEDVGESERLLSLVANTESFTGGAHGNRGFQVILWDRRSQVPVELAKLLSTPKAFAMLTRTSYCAALDAERLKRREGEPLEGEFASCPPYSELSIAPADRDNDGRFDELEFLAAPYVAGPYVEGEYEIALPITSAFVSALLPEYRSSFEAQPQ